MRETYVMRGGKLVPKRLAAPLAREAAPMVISDVMAPTWHPADGKIYESKARFRAETRARGCIEVGTERQTDRRNPFVTDTRAEVRRAVEMVRQGYRPNVQSEHFE